MAAMAAHPPLLSNPARRSSLNHTSPLAGRLSWFFTPTIMVRILPNEGLPFIPIRILPGVRTSNSFTGITSPFSTSKNRISLKSPSDIQRDFTLFKSLSAIFI